MSRSTGARRPLGCGRSADPWIDFYRDLPSRLGGAKCDLPGHAEVFDQLLPDRTLRACALCARLRPASRPSAMAKGHITDAGFGLANRALQLHAGFWYLAEYGMEKIMRLHVARKPLAGH